MDLATDVIALLLDLTGDAMRTGDFDAYAQRFALPQTMRSPQGVQNLTQVSDLRQVFDGVRASMAERGATELVRTVITARFTCATEVSSSHISCWVVDGRRVASPYTCHGVAQLRGGRWLITDSSYLTTTLPGLGAVLAGKSAAVGKGAR